MDNKPPTIAIPVPSDKKLVKLSKLIPAPASCCFKLLETIVDITVLVNESPPKTNTIIIVMNHDVVSNRNEAVKKLSERNVTTMFYTIKVNHQSNIIQPLYTKIMTITYPGQN